ncbi:MAG: N-acetylmuramoyl-L-alanine amidase [Alphaproteobacteria bacterium]|nr:N-acetylmuramoyl-L-alanine amidase [Alphaproteobacteria bacterium]
MKIVERPSPNFNERVGVAGPDILIMHYTGMQSCEAAVARLTSAEAKVSSHYTIDEDGTIYAHVPEQLRAWHAGVSHWRGESDINSRSIGIEIVNPGHEFGYRDFPEAQIEAVIRLSKAIVGRHAIPKRNVIGHSDIAPGRKTDPGELFPWKRLATVGLGVWVDAPPAHKAPLARGASGERVIALQAGLATFGYGIDVNGTYDERTEIVVSAFQRHFRPANFDGVADGETVARLKALNEMLDRIA